MDQSTSCPVRSPNELNFCKNMAPDILSDAEHSSRRQGQLEGKDTSSLVEDLPQKVKIRNNEPHHGSWCVMVFWYQLRA